MVKAKSKSTVRSAKPATSADIEARKARLAEVARLAQIFIDGELIGQLLTDQGQRWTDTDDIDYHYAPFITLKKVVLRLEQTPGDGVPVYVNIWRQRPDDPAKGEPLVAGMKLTKLGSDMAAMPKALRAAILNERTASEEYPGGVLAVFAPLYDSLHHVVGAVEAFDDAPKA
jgi:hypothetical protein